MKEKIFHQKQKISKKFLVCTFQLKGGFEKHK